MKKTGFHFIFPDTEEGRFAEEYIKKNVPTRGKGAFLASLICAHAKSGGIDQALPEEKNFHGENLGASEEEGNTSNIDELLAGMDAFG